jgi:four helix bundle protein
LRVWQASYKAVLEIYRVSGVFPAAERYGLSSQLRRAAVSIVANIAEGAKRSGSIDYARFLNIAQGSVAEAETMLHLAVGLQFVSSKRVSNLFRELDEVARMLSRLRKSVLTDAPVRRTFPERDGS